MRSHLLKTMMKLLGMRSRLLKTMRKLSGVRSHLLKTLMQRSTLLAVPLVSMGSLDKVVLFGEHT